MFEQPSSTTNTNSSSGSGSDSHHYFDLGPRTPGSQVHQTSVIVPPRQHLHQHQQSDSSPLTPCTPYYSTNGYGIPLFFGADFLQFPPSEVTSPLTPSLSSPLTPHPFGPIPAIPTNQIYNRSFSDFYSATSSSPMVQYSTLKKSSAGRKPKEESVKYE